MISAAKSGLPNIPMATKYVFCSPECCEQGPILKLNPSAFKAHCQTLSKNALKCALSSIPLPVYCRVVATMDKDGEPPKERVELPKSEMLKVFLQHRSQMEDPAEGSLAGHSSRNDAEHHLATAHNDDKMTKK